MVTLRPSSLFAAAFEACGPPGSSVEARTAPQDCDNFQEQPTCIRSLRVLVADDNRDAADSLSMLLKLWGHDVRRAYDGVAALELALAFEPDVLLLDIAMPLLDGCQMARQLRQLPRFKNALMVALTGYGDEGHRVLWNAAFDHYLVKPVDPVTVERLLLVAQAKLANLPSPVSAG